MTKRRVHRGFALIALLLGVVHTALGVAAASLTVETLWFTGSGLAIICAALSNLLQPIEFSKAHTILVEAQNVLLTGFFAAAWLIMPLPQVAIGFAMFFALTILLGLQFPRGRQTT